MRSQIRMWSGLHWGLLGLAVLAGTVGPVARGETLRWKFRPGEALHYTMDQKAVTTAKIPGGTEIKTTLSQTIEMTWAVKSVADDGNGPAELTQTIDRIRDQVEAPVGSYTYDSKDPKEPEGLVAAARVPLFKALLGAPIAFKMTARGEPTDVRVPDKVSQALRDLGPAGAGAGALFSEEGLKEMITQASLILPTEDLAAGKTWTRETRHALPPIGTVVLDATYTYNGPARAAAPGAVTIGLATKVEIQPPAPDADADADANKPNPNANGLKIRSQKSRGTYTFDAAAGHILDSNLTEVIDVAATIKVGQGATARDMELVQTTETTTLRKLTRAEQPSPGR